jgi:hypothetical protein
MHIIILQLESLQYWKLVMNCCFMMLHIIVLVLVLVLA